MNRQLTTAISADDNSYTLAQELVRYGFINDVSNVFFRYITRSAKIQFFFRWIEKK